MKCIKPFSQRNAMGIWQDFPCGQCVCCKINRSREWAFRMVAESDYWPHSAFLTLTYSDDEVISLDKRDLQLFFKRLRKNGLDFRYYACGEYGSETYRPHYHVCLFYRGVLDFTRDLSFGVNNGHLREWTHGVTNLGTFTKESARYVSDYLLKGAGQELPSFLSPSFRLVSKGMGARWIFANKEAFEKYGVRFGDSYLPIPRYFKELMSFDSTCRNRIVAKKRTERLLTLGRFGSMANDLQREANILAKQGVRKEALSG